MILNNGNLLIIGLETLERIEIQYIPENLNLSRNASINEIGVIGRNTPLFQHSGGSTDLTMNLDFHSVAESRTDVLKKVNWLRSLTYNDGFNRPAQKVKIVFGDIFRHELWVVKRVSANLSLFDPQFEYLPKQAYVTVTFGLDPQLNFTWNNLLR